MTTKEVVKHESEFKTLADLFNKSKTQIAKVIPAHLTADRLVRVSLTAFQRTPKLFQCTTQSILKALMDAAQIGLEPDGINAHLIPYYNSQTKSTEANYQTDYKGLIRLARLSEEVAYMTADAVYENDKFEHEYGTNQHLTHIKVFKNRGERVASYSYVKYKDGTEDFKVLTADDVERAKKCSKTQNSSDSVWNKYPDAMWAKTAVRQHAKFLPRQKLLQTAAILDEKIDMDLAELAPPKIETKTQENTDNLKKNLGKNYTEVVDESATEQDITFHEKLLEIKGDFVRNGGGLNEFNEKLADLGVKDPGKLSQIKDPKLQEKILEHFKG